MNSVSGQIQRAISDAISTQVLPQIQNVIMAGSGHGTRKGWDVPSERPELISEVQRNLNAKNNLRNEQDENQLNNDYPDLNVHDSEALLRKFFLVSIWSLFDIYDNLQQTGFSKSPKGHPSCC